MLEVAIIVLSMALALFALALAVCLPLVVYRLINHDTRLTALESDVAKLDQNLTDLLNELAGARPDQDNKRRSA